jgi:hypothetical protein
MENSPRVIRRTLGVILAFVCLTAVACSSSSKSSTAKDAAPFAQTSEDGKFTAEFPSVPKRAETPISAAGLDLVVVSYATDNDDESVIVGYTDYPTEDFDTTGVLDAAAEGSASNVDGTIESSTDTTFVGQPAKDVVITTKEATVNERLFLVGHRLYTIIGVAKSGRPASYDHLIDTFVLI